MLKYHCAQKSTRYSLRSFIINIDYEITRSTYVLFNISFQNELKASHEMIEDISYFEMKISALRVKRNILGLINNVG
jgi:hypothetical protein